MTGVVKPDYSPKKGKENKNISNHIPVPTTLRKTAKNETKPHLSPKKELKKEDSASVPNDKSSIENKLDKTELTQDGNRVGGCIDSTGSRPVRPQTKILRRPTPNLKHPVIQVDSDDSGGDSSSSDKSKEDDNPKRLKMGCENGSSEFSAHKTKNFIMYNKHNVDKNIKNTQKERTSASLPTSIPNPCNSCNRTMAPERLHSHARKDARGLMHSRKSPATDSKSNLPVPEVKTMSSAVDVKMASVVDVKAIAPIVNGKANSQPTDSKIPSSNIKIPSPVMDVKMTKQRTSNNNKVTSPAIEVKMASPTINNKAVSTSIDVKMLSPQKKVPDNAIRSKIKRRDIKRSSSLERTKDGSIDRMSSDIAQELKTEAQNLSGSISIISDDQDVPLENFLEPIKVCYICQKEFKVSLLLLHESKCLEEWKKTNNALTPNLRQLPPRRPLDHDLPLSIPSPDSEDADDPAWSTVQSQLVPCPLCTRTFFPERMPVHRRVCKGRQSPRPLKRASSLREQSASSTEGEEAKSTPLYLPCYVCNRNYGSWVLPMHEEQCLKKWRKENEKLSEEDKQEEPQRNTEFNLDDDVASLIELGDTAWESHLQQLVPCPRCSRTFFPDRLQIHQRSCKGSNSSSNRRPRSKKGN